MHGFVYKCCPSTSAASMLFRYLPAGNHNATAYVYDTSTGLQAARVEAIRVQGSVRACGLSEDCRHLLMAVGSGYVFRFEYRPAAESEDGEEAATEGEIDELSLRAGSTTPPVEVTWQDKQQSQQQSEQQGQQQLQGEQQEQRHAPADGMSEPTLPSISTDGGQPVGQRSHDHSLLVTGQACEVQHRAKYAGLHPPMQEQSDLQALTSKTPDHGDTWGTSLPNSAAGWMAAENDAGDFPGTSGATPASGAGELSGLRLAGQHKKPRLTAGAEVQVSPLVFRPTP